MSGEARDPKTVILNQNELAVRLIEAYTGSRRPKGATPRDALLSLDSDMCAGFMRAAEAAMTYMVETLSEGGPVTVHKRTERQGLH